MTGLRPSSTGIYGLAPWFRNVDQLEDVVSLPQAFREVGYKTYTAGKIYHGGYGRNTERDNEWDVIGPQASGKPFPEDGKLVNTPQAHRLVDWGTFPHKDEDKGDWEVASWVEEQLLDMDDEPFFMSCGFFLPHVPLFATEKWFDLYPEDESVLPSVLRNDREDTPRFSWYLHWKLPEPRLRFLEEEDEWVNISRSYLACISFMDSQLGRVLDALEKGGHSDDTLVVLWSDHGFHLGEKEITGKNTLWEESTRVPLIFSGYEINGGRVCGKPVELLDIFPTLVELCELNPRDHLEGHSLVPLLEDVDADRPWPAITTHNHDNHGVRWEDWRYIQYADGTEELYDHRVDPNEWNNLANEERHRDIIEKSRKALPRINRKPAPGSSARILTYEEGVATWQGEAIGEGDPIPEI